MSDTDPAAEPIDEPTNETPDAEARDTDTDASSESREPVTGEDLIDAVAQRRDTINYRASSYDQGRHEELTWVLDLIDPEPAHEELEGDNGSEVSDTEVTDDDDVPAESDPATREPFS